MANPPTTNYGWTKPVVGGDGDAWGGEINADLDSIDATVKSVSNAIPLASSTAPVMDGSAVAGTGTTWARADHVHPTDTSRYAANNPSGYQTAAQVTAVLPVVATTAPLMNGVATIGASGKWADGAHIHPTDTTLAPLASPTFTGTPSLPIGTIGVTQTAGNSTTALATTAFVATSFAPLASPAFTGAPSLPTGTTGVTQAPGDNSTRLATTAFVSALPVAMNDNRIINGDMRIDQRNNGASGTATAVYTVDRWMYLPSQSAKGTWQGQSNNATVLAVTGFNSWLSFSSSSAYASLATDYFYFGQPIEADMVTDFAWGTASAKAVTLSFWASVSQAGNYSGSVCNFAGTRSYPFSFPVTAGWSKIVITIPGDAGGTWVMSGNAGALYVRFDLGSGANWRASANAWASGNYVGVTGSASVVATNGAVFNVTGVKLEVGNIATPFNRQSLAKSLADCQRYYQSLNGILLGGYSSTGGGIYQGYTLPVQMRSAPTVVFANVSYGNASSLATYGTPTVTAMGCTANITSTGGGTAFFTANIGAEL